MNDLFKKAFKHCPNFEIATVYIDFVAHCIDELDMVHIQNFLLGNFIFGIEWLIYFMDLGPVNLSRTDGRYFSDRRH